MASQQAVLTSTGTPNRQAGATADDGREGPARLVLRGRLDALEAMQRRADLERLARSAVADGAAVLVDLSAVEFIDSAGLAALVRLRRQVEEAGAGVILVRPAAPAAWRIFELTGLDQVFDVSERPPTR